MLSELLDKFDSGDLKVEGKIFKAYPTKGHLEQDKPWWFPDEQLNALAEIRRKEITAVLWGKKIK